MDSCQEAMTRLWYQINVYFRGVCMYNKSKHGMTLGLTLVEIIISIAILAIIAVSFLAVFMNGYRNTTRAGYKSKADYNAQQAIENYLTGASYDPAISLSSTTTSVTVVLKTDPIGGPMVVVGKEITVISQSGDSASTMITFSAD